MMHFLAKPTLQDITENSPHLISPLAYGWIGTRPCSTPPNLGQLYSLSNGTLGAKNCRTATPQSPISSVSVDRKAKNKQLTTQRQRSRTRAVRHCECNVQHLRGCCRQRRDLLLTKEIVVLRQTPAKGKRILAWRPAPGSFNGFRNPYRLPENGKLTVSIPFTDP